MLLGKVTWDLYHLAALCEVSMDGRKFCKNLSLHVLQESGIYTGGYISVSVWKSTFPKCWKSLEGIGIDQVVPAEEFPYMMGSESYLGYHIGD